MPSRPSSHVPALAALTLVLILTPMVTAAPPVLRLATTTSTEDTGLLKALLPAFEKQCGCRVEVIAVGTGQALELGRRGDADVVLVHARQAEDEFIAAGHARERHDVMYNDFVLVGPAADPAKVAGIVLARDAFSAVARAPFASRGDRSGTDIAEKAIWKAAGIAPAGAGWYRSLGQGMGETLVSANELLAYTLSDRATWLAMREKLPGLGLLLGGKTLAENRDPGLRNFYSVMAVDAAAHPGVNAALAGKFVEWLLSRDAQRVIGRFGVERFGQPLFYPNAPEPRTTREVSVTTGSRSRTFTIADLRALPRETLPGYGTTGVKVGPVGVFDWAGASLKDVLLQVDPAVAQPRHAGSRIVLVSSDGWTATVWWDELFGALTPGAAVYNTKGCNECHGVRGEGTAPSGKRPAPALAGKAWPADRVLAILRAGGRGHAGINPYTESQFSAADARTLAAWFADPRVTGQWSAPAGKRRPVLLAYERNGQPLDGRDGLIQLVVGADEFAGRYSHWVKTITVVQ